MLKVAVITDYFPTSAQPWAGHSAYQTLRILAKSCRLRVFYPQATYPAMFRPKGSDTTPLDPAGGPADVESVIVPYRAFPILSRPLNGFSIARALFAQVKQMQPDVLLSYVIYPNGYAAVRIAERLGLPVLLTAIGSDLNRIPDPLCGALTRAALRRASYVSTVSEDLCETAKRLGSDPTHTTSKLNGCNTEVFHPRDRQQARLDLGLNPDAEIILYVGRLDIRKGLIELIHAVTALRHSRSRLHCYMVGNGTDRTLLAQTIAECVAHDFITLIPACLTEEIARWMAAADLITLPSYNEGCPNVILEGLSAGRPVVATRVGGIPELMDETCGRLVPVRDVPALSHALGEVLDAEWDAHTISAKHSRSWSDVSAELYKVLETLVSARH